MLTWQDQEPTDWTSDGLKMPIDPDAPYENYAYCLHTAMLLLLGDNVYPTTAAQRYYCTVALLIGACVVATIMGNVSLLIQNQNSLSAKFKTKMDCVNESMRALNFPHDMVTRVLLCPAVPPLDEKTIMSMGLRKAKGIVAAPAGVKLQQ